MVNIADAFFRGQNQGSQIRQGRQREQANQFKLGNQQRVQELIGTTLGQTRQPQQPVDTADRDTALIELFQRDPNVAIKIKDELGLRSEQQQREGADFAFRAGRESDPERRNDMIQQRVQTLQSQGRDARETIALLDRSHDEQSKLLRTVELALMSPADREKAVTPEKAAVGTASQRDFETFKRLEKDDPEAAKIFGRQAGFLRSTDQEKADIKVDEAVRKEVAKANTKRKQGFIGAGIDAADSASNIKRSIQLLETVKTGGIDAILNEVNRVFGVQGANEVELSTNLGKNVLAQLKPIFGSAFTASEGDKLDKIEASFGKSTAGNIRLLKSALRLVDRAARRGIAAAEDQGDTFTAGEIRASLEAVVPATEKDEEQTQTEQTTGQDASQDVNDGDVVVNTSTGQRLQLVNGQFVEVQ